MIRIARIIVAALLVPAIVLISLAGSASAQTPLFEVENGDAIKLLQVQDDAGFVLKGTINAGMIPAAGSGTRLMWYPGKAAFRAGNVGGTQWDDQNVGPASVALGENTMASGNHAIALGVGTAATAAAATAWGNTTTASGQASTAMGSNTIASADYSTAMGAGSTASANYSTAMGVASIASGPISTAMGNYTRASGQYSTAMGDRSAAGGVSSVAMGYATLASGAYSIAVGFGTKATAERTVAMGDNTTASATWATALGDHTTAAGLASVAMGSYVTAGNGSFIFGDRSTTQVQTAGSNEFLVRVHGGVGFNSGTNIGCDLPAGVGTWACTSSRLAKEGFEDMDGEAVLAKLARIPIQRWSYLGTRAAHVGPTAEDFHGAFGLGEGPTTISTVDADGIALLGVQTLERRTAELRVELASLRAELAAIRHDMVAAARAR